EPGAPPVIDLLTRLMDKSWLHATTDGDAARYRQLETVKEYVITRLKEAGEEKIARDTHRDCFAQLAQSSNHELRGKRQRDALRTFDAEHENLKAAVAWSSAQRDGKTLQLVANLWRYWMMRGLATSGRLVLEDALASAPQEQKTERASALLGAGWLARFQGDSSSAQQRLMQSAELHREIGDLAGEAEARMHFT